MSNFQGAMNGGGEKCSDAGYVRVSEPTGFQIRWMLDERGKGQGCL